MVTESVGAINSENCNLLPQLSKNLFSVPVITDNDGTVIFSKKGVEIWEQSSGRC
jgi:hypothetical protein